MDFEGVKAGLAGNSITLVDVRNPDEVAAGKIPGSKNIPREFDHSVLDLDCDFTGVFVVPEVEAAFNMDEAAFKEKYGFDKPAKDAAIVTHCLKGGRAAKGADAMTNLGYSNVKVYAGSFTDWKEKGGEVTQ